MSSTLLKCRPISKGTCLPRELKEALHDYYGGLVQHKVVYTDQHFEGFLIGLKSQAVPGVDVLIAQLKKHGELELFEVD